jgi:SAM-dependent methyltransferase
MAGRTSYGSAMTRSEGLRSVVEVGCGAGRDGKVLSSSGLAYQGLDLSPASVAICRELGLEAQEGSALDLPFAADEFDAGWSMSTLMHLTGDGLTTALAELKRVIRPGGLLEVGVWGGDEDREWTDAHGRYFQSRTDRRLRAMLAEVGQVVAFETWSPFDDGGHYQWARVLVA